MNRRRFLIATGASSLVAMSPVWADVGAPGYVTAGNRPGTDSALIGVTLDGEVRFAFDIPGRGHAAATHPFRAEAVAFARRPGRFAVVLGCADGQEIARLHAPEGLHFYGHGAFSGDGRYLFTTENAYDVPDGRLGIWDAENGYARVGEVAAGGIGPHEMIRLPGGGFAVANGGIQTHPVYARSKLNLGTMQPNLTILSEAGETLSQQQLPADMRLNSVRHIDVGADGTVIAALQWQGAPMQAVPLVARFVAGQAPQLIDHPDTAQIKQYAGSVAISPDGGEIAVSGPKGDHVLFFDGAGKPRGVEQYGRASGIAKTPDGLMITCAGGFVRRSGGVSRFVAVEGGWIWDNHLVRVS